MNILKDFLSRPVLIGRKTKPVRQIGNKPDMIFPCGFFDGASITSAASIGYCVFFNKITIWIVRWGSDMVPIRKLNFWVYGPFCSLPKWWVSRCPTFMVTHRLSLIGRRVLLLSPHQTFITGAGKQKILFQAFMISLSVTSIVNTIRL